MHCTTHMQRVGIERCDKGLAPCPERMLFCADLALLPERIRRDKITYNAQHRITQSGQALCPNPRFRLHWIWKKKSEYDSPNELLQTTRLVAITACPNCSLSPQACRRYATPSQHKIKNIICETYLQQAWTPQVILP